MSVAARVAALATYLGGLLRIERASFAPSSGTGSDTVTIRKRLGVVTVEGSITLASGLASGSNVVVGSIPAGFRPVKQAGAGAFFYSPTGGPGAVIVSAAGEVRVAQYSGSTRGALAFSITYEAA